MNVALYGGKFDPPHLGHKNLIDQVLARMKFIDEVWIIPAKDHPWRKIYASGKDRKAMLELLGSDRVKVLDLELKRKKPTITIDTVRELKKNYPKNNFFWICGSDTPETFHLWDKHEELVKLVKFYVYPRPGYVQKKLPKGFFAIPYLCLPRKKFSSTEARRLAAQEKPLRGLVAPAVEEYIQRHHLYQTGRKSPGRAGAPRQNRTVISGSGNRYSIH